MVDPMHFDGMAGTYATARPAYPGELWRDVFATGLAASGYRALDLGAGTGEATGPLLARGMDVVAVEPGASLAGILKERCPQAVVIRARAEDFRPDAATFDLAIAATSFHWMDPDVVLRTVHEALAPEGRLLVWRNVFGDEEAEVTPFRREVQRIVERRGADGPPRSEDAAITAAEIAGTQLFSVERMHRYRWSVELLAHQIHALFATFSNWTESEAADAASAVEALGGTVTEHYSSWLVDARPIR